VERELQLACAKLAQRLREARSTIEALNKDLQGLSDDDDDERAELLQEFEELKHLKRSIRKQITETRRSGGDANDNLPSVALDNAFLPE
jgi:predicted  nucleic acid-binding Zn-ribbon protein